MHEKPVTGTALANPYFLLSYPHTPYNGNGNGSDREPDYWVEMFFNDLCRALEELGVPRLAKLGVFDRDLWLFNDWRTGLPEALATCRVLVALCAPRYFQSLACGKEWAAFAGRPPGKGMPDAVPPIVPVMWKPMKPGELPPAAQAVPVDYCGLASYTEFGLESIIMRTMHREDYHAVVRRVAERVKTMAEVAAPPSGAIDYDELSSPFAPGLKPMPGDHPLRITLIAPCKGDLPPGRAEELYYGRTALDWNPYATGLPEPGPEPAAGSAGSSAVLREPIAEYAANFARSQGFRPYVADLQEHGPDLLKRRPPTAPELLIVDPWAVLRPECARQLMRFNLPAKPWIQLVIPWNRGDRELVAAGDMLWPLLDDVLGPKLDQVRVTARLAVEGVPGLDDMSAILPDLMLAAKKHYFRYAEVPAPFTPPEHPSG